MDKIFPSEHLPMSVFFKKLLVKAMFAFTVFELLLFENRSVLSPAQRGTGSERVKVPVKNKANVLMLLKLLGK